MVCSTDTLAGLKISYHMHMWTEKHAHANVNDNTDTKTFVFHDFHSDRNIVLDFL